MKFKKYSYLLVFILMLVVGTNEVYGLTCGDLFGSGEGSLRELINDIIVIPKYVVPVIIIVLGMIDLAKATLASKEDEMKKAQITFVKRVFIGVAVFLVPTVVNLIMSLADIVWGHLGYSGCDLSTIINISNLIR